MVTPNLTYQELQKLVIALNTSADHCRALMRADNSSPEKVTECRQVTEFLCICLDDCLAALAARDEAMRTLGG